MLERLMGITLDKQPLLRELDPASYQRIVEGNYLKRFIGEAQVASRKCTFFAENCLNEDVQAFFTAEAKLIDQSSKLLKYYYEKIPKEAKH